MREPILHSVQSKITAFLHLGHSKSSASISTVTLFLHAGHSTCCRRNAPRNIPPPINIAPIPNGIPMMVKHNTPPNNAMTAPVKPTKNRVIVPNRPVRVFFRLTSIRMTLSVTISAIITRPFCFYYSGHGEILQLSASVV